MTASTYVTIWCDCQGCDSHPDHPCGLWCEPGSEEPTAARSRRRARRAGWRTAQPGGKDFCPRCLPRPYRRS